MPEVRAHRWCDRRPHLPGRPHPPRVPAQLPEGCQCRLELLDDFRVLHLKVPSIGTAVGHTVSRRGGRVEQNNDRVAVGIEAPDRGTAGLPCER
jgi:hypothetical protein